jgi:hypothetical protein
MGDDGGGGGEASWGKNMGGHKNPRLPLIRPDKGMNSFVYFSFMTGF